MTAPNEPEAQPPQPGPHLRGPSGCLEWAVVVMGAVYLVLLVLFIVVLALR